MKSKIHADKSVNTFFPAFLPMYSRELKAIGWDAVDVLLITGDAYVDHPAFGAALLGRFLMTNGYRVGIIAQPRWDTMEDITRLGRPRLFAGITAGALDSMLAHYTAFRKLRHDDAYTPGNKHGARPNRAAIVYTGLVRQAFPGLPVVIGGIEASLRRASHYDFWSDKLRRSILLDSKADLLVYGMGERAILETAKRLDKPAGENKKTPLLLHGISGTAFAASSLDSLRTEGTMPDAADCITLPSHEDILAEPKALMTATLALEQQVHQGTHWATQQSGNRWVVLTPPALPLTEQEIDALYQMPFARRPHPSYKLPIPAADMIQFSITAHRGCAAGCTFCSITMHQGRQVQSRSENSLIEEARALTRHRDWKGSISDVGGPTANMWGAKCTADPATCRRKDCLFPRQCPHFKINDERAVRLLRKIASLNGIKHVRVASGIRYDINAQDNTYLRALVREFVGGQLKVAPEHINDNVLKLMRKPVGKYFEQFLELFAAESRNAGKEQYVIPYLISAFPGCTDSDMRELAQWLKRRGWRPQQVQCFIPTPGTIATAMYYAGIDEKGNPIPVARTDRERLKQHHILAGETREP